MYKTDIKMKFILTIFNSNYIVFKMHLNELNIKYCDM